MSSLAEVRAARAADRAQSPLAQVQSARRRDVGAQATPDGRSTAPGTLPSEAARIPEGMVFDPQTGGYHDAGAYAQRAGPALGFAGNVLAGRIFQGEYTDEAMGQADSALTGRSPEIVQERARQATEQYAEDRPVTALGARVLGGVGSTVGAMQQIRFAAPRFAAWASSLIPASTTFQTAAGVGAGAAAGAVEGAVSGYGAGRGDDRAATSAQYGMFGSAAGGVGGLVAPIANKVAQGLKSRWARAKRSIDGMSADATEEVVEAVSADMAAGGVQSNVRRAGDAAMIADAGQTTAGLLDASVAMSQRGGAVAGRRVNERMNMANGHLQGAFNDVMGGPQGVASLNEAVEAALRPGIKDAYKEAYSTPLQYGGTGQARAQAESALAVFNSIPSRFKSEALTMAREMMELDGVPPQLLIKVDENGNAIASRMPGVAEMDYVKRALNAIVQDNTDEFGKVGYKGRTAAIYARRLRDAVADAVPAYSRALSQASDEFALKEAIQMGDRLLNPKTTREEVARWAAQASDIEKRNAAAGLRAQIDELMANARPTRGNPSNDAAEAKRILDTMRSRAAKTKIQALLGPKEARRVIKAIDEAARANELANNVARNSATASRLARDNRIRERQAFSPGQIGRDAASGELFSAGRKLTQTAAGNTPSARDARVEQMYLEIAEYLTGRRGEDALQAAERLISRAEQNPVDMEQLQRIGRNASAAIGLPVGQAATQSQRTGPR